MLTNTPPPSENNTFAFLSTLEDDIPAGIAVFLVSIPLSLGIALASGAPLFSGLITGIIGGLVVAPLSGSTFGISGTAAGLTVLILPAIESLGFETFLLAVFFAGLCQILLGILKAGVITHYFPSSVISGMLTGIGIIILLKQIPHIVGYDVDYEGDFSFNQIDNYSSFSELFHMMDQMQPGAILISSVSLIIIALWELPFFKNQYIFTLVRAPLMVVITGVFINGVLQHLAPNFALGTNHLVSLPILNSVDDLHNQLHFPDFAQINNPKVYTLALTLAFVASLETLLCVEATAKLDKLKRIAPTNRELIAQGIGNSVLALLGGLPLTQVVVRSSINIQSGAKSKASAIINGILLLDAVVLASDWLNKIPLASLATILLAVGYRLASKETFERLYKSGWYQFIPFLATVLALVFTNITVGILLGLSIALFTILLQNYRGANYLKEGHVGNKIIIRLSEHVSFLNKANIQQSLKELPENSEVVIDATRAKYVDYDVYEIIENFKTEASQRRIKLILENMRGFGSLPPVEFERSQTYESQRLLTPDKILELLKEGNERFVYNLKSNRNLLEQINDTSDGQFPIAIILSCMDSRTSVELIFDLGLGDVFSARIAGNIINDDILGSMEFACKLAGSKLIVVLGHSHCGAIKGACDNAQLDHLTGLLTKIKPAINCVHSENPDTANLDNDILIQKVADKNVELTVEHIRSESQLLADMEKSGEIAIIGGMYDIETGKVNFFEHTANH